MPLLELEKPILQVNIPNIKQTSELFDTRKIGRAFSHNIALHRSGIFKSISDDEKRFLLNESNKLISRGDSLVEKALDNFHSKLFAQTGRIKTVDVEIINSIVELAKGKI